jgi:hypothetical protein
MLVFKQLFTFLKSVLFRYLQWSLLLQFVINKVITIKKVQKCTEREIYEF